MDNPINYTSYRELSEDVEFIVKNICHGVESLVRDKHRYRSIPRDSRKYIEYFDKVFCRFLEDGEVDLLIHPLDKLYMVLSILTPPDTLRSSGKALMVDPRIMALHHIFQSIGDARDEVKSRIRRLISYLATLREIYSNTLSYIEDPTCSLIASMGVHVTREIGSNTYLGKDLDNGEDVVIKFVDKSLTDPDVLSVFAKNFYEGIPRIKFYREIGDQYVVVREYVKGKPLSELRGKSRSGELSGLINIFTQVLRILGNIYGETLILHHDLHSKNIILSDSGKVYVIDWIYAGRAGELHGEYYRGDCRRVLYELISEPTKLQEELYCEIYTLTNTFWEVVNGSPYSGGTSYKYLDIELNKLFINVLGGSRDCILSIIESDNPFTEYLRILEKYVAGPKKHVCLEW